MKIFGGQAFLKIAALATAGMAVSGCTYDMGLGYASDGYYGDYYDCDPYGGYDSYYSCDYGHGFYNIGYGGGWYDNYWYPGYGFYLFDRYGSRYPMRDSHRRYWGEQRHRWYREHRGRDGDPGRYQGRGRGYTDNATPGAIGWPERNGGRVRDGNDGRGRGEGRRSRNDQWRGGDGTGANAVPAPNPDDVRGRGDGKRGDGQGRGRWRGNDGSANAVPVPQQGQPGVRQGGRGERARGGGEGRGYRQPPAQSPSGQAEAPAYRPAPQPRAEGGRQQAPRQRTNEGAAEQPE